MTRDLQNAIEFLQSQQQLINRSARNAQLAAQFAAENAHLRQEIAKLKAQQIPTIDDGEFARIPKAALKEMLDDYEFRMGNDIERVYENSMTPAPSFREYAPELYELFMRMNDACY